MASQDKANSVWPFDTLLSVSDHLYIKKCQLRIRKSDTALEQCYTPGRGTLENVPPKGQTLCRPRPP